MWILHEDWPSGVLHARVPHRAHPYRGLQEADHGLHWRARAAHQDFRGQEVHGDDAPRGRTHQVYATSTTRIPTCPAPTASWATAASASPRMSTPSPR